MENNERSRPSDTSEQESDSVALREPSSRSLSVTEFSIRM